MNCRSISSGWMHFVTAAGVVVAALVAGARPLLSVPFLGIVEGGDLRLVVDGLSAVLVLLVASCSWPSSARSTLEEVGGFFIFRIIFLYSEFFIWRGIFKARPRQT